MVKALFNRIIGKEPKTGFIWKKRELTKSIVGFRLLLHEAHREPMKCKQLIMVYPHFVGIMDVAKEGTGGVVVGARDEYIPTVFCLEWPQDDQDMVCMEDNPVGQITD